MNLKYIRIKVYLIMLLPITLLLNYTAGKNPNIVNKIYSTSIYRGIAIILSNITGIIPFSLAEIIIIAAYVLIFYFVISLVVRLIRSKGKKFQLLKEFLVNVLLVVSLVYFSFIMLWGLNYNRITFDKIASLKIEPASINELKDLNLYLVKKANELRVKVRENEEGVMILSNGFKGVRDEAAVGYEKASEKYPFFSGDYGKPKGIFLSKLMCYTGISGMYFPFTAEANINTSIPDFMLPAATCHEMAHQRGFAKEQEANYIAYITCLANPREEFQYSGVMLALIYSMNSLYSEDKATYMEIRDRLSEGVLRDLEYNKEFWDKYDGKMRKFSDELNDKYLKANNQKQGTKSYGMMVDLLLAEHRKTK